MSHLEHALCCFIDVFVFFFVLAFVLHFLLLLLFIFFCVLFSSFAYDFSVDIDILIALILFFLIALFVHVADDLDSLRRLNRLNSEKLAHKFGTCATYLFLAEIIKS